MNKIFHEVYTMATVKITERDILNSIINGTADPDVLVEYATKRIGQLDKRNAAAAKRAAVKRAEADEITEVIYGLLSDEPMNRDMVVDALAEQGIEMTPNKVTARLTKLYKEGRVNKEKGKVEGPDGKAKESTMYTIA
jgi:hypothetical protein